MSASSSPPLSTSLPLSSSFLSLLSSVGQGNRRVGRRLVGEAGVRRPATSDKAATATTREQEGLPHAAATVVADRAGSRSCRHGSSIWSVSLPWTAARGDGI